MDRSSASKTRSRARNATPGPSSDEKVDLSHLIFTEGEFVYLNLIPALDRKVRAENDARCRTRG
jgi:hypothetical protein